ncbi:fungal zn(2)-Cys(6) binuclear cluster domain-containing protein [Hirsutella rhossiliensis]|uniref:Fungal zn(2)-Cys(6) binuclear cluster domain-containing protein n=1 Tax=Hirsutella rhossiliensis TaxID=111463 RepID=A0A9P8MM10_9HYPO|nr:fungal zn(2)-Cys(6) binuclear cluster domain-containing protein [Hirsutella rhossiliensis]KAH0957457.1 fungal zn(2)-Cys(6) binuclear cluster domain-containing protein [Hirsutella rhossiliensis]
MPPRRSHKKSRAGCRRCKGRKIKCDEMHPRCGNCVKHGVSCDFDGPIAPDEPVPDTPTAVTPAAVTPTVTLAVSEAPSPQQPSPSLHAPPATPLLPVASASASPRQVDRFMELRLLHHFTTSTSKTLFTRPPSTEDVWQRAVPQMAFEGRPYLMDAILSVAALHLRFQHPRDVALARASHAYTASALAEYCASLERGITAHNAEALFLTASLIAFQSTASRIFAKDDAEPDTGNAHSTSRYVLPMPWFHAFQGVKTVVATSWQWIRHSDIVKAVIDSQPSFQLDLNPLGPNSFFGHLLDGLDDELANEPAQRVSATSQGYSHAVSVLNWAHKNAHAPAALAFPASVSRRFLEVVEEKRPRALAILACFFALLKRMDNVWWLDNVARREVTGLVSMLEPGSPWWRHLEWPVRISVWDGNEIPSDVWGAECESQPQGDRGLAETMMSHIELLTSQTRPPKSPSLPGGGEFGLAVAPLD